MFAVPLGAELGGPDRDTDGCADVGVRVAGRDLGELTALFTELELERRRVDARLAMVVGEVDRRGLYAIDGHATVKGWCRATGRWSSADAVA
ncbi:MAG: hypothetical protein F2789_14740, partial [Actinobacteria bacterium]|nr:hypothetical protein [Actinomycetota bacterium]